MTTIRNHSITVDEYVVNAHLVAKITAVCEQKDIGLLSLLNHSSLEEKREYLRELDKSENRMQYLSFLKQRLSNEADKQIEMETE